MARSAIRDHSNTAPDFASLHPGYASSFRSGRLRYLFVEVMLNKRVAVRVDPERVRSWDHHKLGMDPTPLGGTTAEFL
jgi:hypothetical protein